MADKPSGARNFFGRVVDRILPGTNYNRDTGQYSNVGTGLAGLGARLIATSFAGPAAGALVGKAAGYLIDRNGNQIGPVQREGIAGPGGVTTGYTGAVTMPNVSNLGLGAQPPGGTWAGYLQGQGSVNNFGNQNFTRPGGALTNWAPASTWGQSIQQGQGSNLNFGNYSPGASAASGGAGRGGGGAGVGVNSGARRGGGNSVGDAGGARSAFWRRAYEQN